MIKVLVLFAAISTFGMVHAKAVTIGPGESVAFNFDLPASGVLLPPPYDGFVFSHNKIDLEPGTEGVFRFYPNLNGQGDWEYTGDSFSSFGFSAFDVPEGFFEDVFAGVFSVVYTVETGSITLEPSIKTYKTATPPNGVTDDIPYISLSRKVVPRLYTDVVSVPDINGDGAPDTAGLTGRRVTILDSLTGQWIAYLNFFGSPWDVKEIASLDSNGDGMPDLAALGQSLEDGRIVVLVRDIRTRNRIARMRFFADQKMTPIGMTVGDIDFNGAPDIGVMAYREDGRVAVEYRDGATGKQLPDWVRDRIWFPAY